MAEVGEGLAVPVDLIVFLAALVVSGLLLTWLLRIVKTTITTAITVAAIALVLQLLFGVGPADLWQHVSQIFQTIWEQISLFSDQQNPPAN